MRVCAICKLGVREGQPQKAVRVPPNVERNDLEPNGVYSACPDCIEALKPAICAKLAADGYSFTPETLPGNFLV